jgi:FkbH-like protein
MNFVFRNSMVEGLFPKTAYVLSDYGSPFMDVDADNVFWVNFLLPTHSSDGIETQVLELKNHLKVAMQASRGKPFYILGLFKPQLAGDDLDVSSPIDQSIYEFNFWVKALAKESAAVTYLEPQVLLRILGFSSFSSKFYFSSAAVISPLLSKKFANWLQVVERMTKGIRKKLLVLDLDNTLWGGVIGEDGWAGIKAGDTYPGNCFRYMQLKVKELSKSGIILAICSKNNHEDVKEVFEKNTDISLKETDFTVIKANWNDKSQNIAEILGEINVGIDSCLFLDDNPLERDLVRQSFPEITVPDFPSKPYDIPEFIDEISFQYFFSASLTNEDNVKGSQYRIRAKGEAERANYPSKLEFLNGLRMEGLIIKNVTSVIPRLVQMTQKTNQFNLTTIRHDELTLGNILSKEDFVLPLSVSDKYGDHGLTGLCIGEKTAQDTVAITSFLMSCRILGREIEFDFLQWCLFYFREFGIKFVTARYEATDKNKQVSDFYGRSGFVVSSFDDLVCNYSLDLTEYFQNLEAAKIIDIRIM